MPEMVPDWRHNRKEGRVASLMKLSSDTGGWSSEGAEFGGGDEGKAGGGVGRLSFRR